MSLKGTTLYVVLAEGQYPGNASLPELFENEEDAKERVSFLEAQRYDGKQFLWCEIEYITIQ
jgi:hypothetical protein